MSGRFGRVFQPLLKKLLNQLGNILAPAESVERVADLHVGALPQEQGKLLVVGVAALAPISAFWPTATDGTTSAYAANCWR
jgi:hypothetical protein